MGSHLRRRSLGSSRHLILSGRGRLRDELKEHVHRRLVGRGGGEDCFFNKMVSGVFFIVEITYGERASF